LRTINSLFIGSLLISLVGCGGGKDTKYRIGDDQFESCDFKYDQGDAYSSHPDELKTTHFSKVYSRHHLKNIHQASAAQTFKYMTEKGQVDVFRGTEASKGCPMFKAIARPPKEFQEKWNESDSSVESDGDKLLGIYLPKDDLISGSPATIIVRNDTSRWTLVHEFLHHLFELENIKDGKTQRRMIYSYVAATMELNVLLDLKYSEIKPKLQRAIDLAAKILVLYDHLLVGSALEEMTIESEMMADFSSFSFMPKSFRSAKSYVEYSYKGGLGRYKKILDELSPVRDFINLAKLEKLPIETKDYDAIQSKIYDRVIEMDALNRQSQKVQALVQLNPVGLMLFPNFSDEAAMTSSAVSPSTLESSVKQACPHTEAILKILDNSF
jgi:hypothetical protein